jgi:hypothetical protein
MPCSDKHTADFARFLELAVGQALNELPQTVIRRKLFSKLFGRPLARRFRQQYAWGRGINYDETDHCRLFVEQRLFPWRIFLHNIDGPLSLKFVSVLVSHRSPPITYFEANVTGASYNMLDNLSIGVVQDRQWEQKLTRRMKLRS